MTFIGVVLLVVGVLLLVPRGVPGSTSRGGLLNFGSGVVMRATTRSQEVGPRARRTRVMIGCACVVIGLILMAVGG